jgi:enoyl-CoA hydratase
MKNLTVLPNAIFVISINRPQALNALNQETLQELQTVINECIGRSDCKGIIITGEGEKAFVAGADIKEIASIPNEKAFEFSKYGQDLFKMIEDSPKPVIAVVNGFALGGGCELAMACHLRIATENAKFGLPEVSLGIIPGYGGTQRLAQLVGRGKALELAMTGDMISASEAKEVGLVNHVTATKEEALALAEKIMNKIFLKGPRAIAALIKSVNAGFGQEKEGYHEEAKNFAALTTTKDFIEGTTAFLEKRKPNFKGE